jgi:hypothetical protein
MPRKTELLMKFGGVFWSATIHAPRYRGVHPCGRLTAGGMEKIMWRKISSLVESVGFLLITNGVNLHRLEKPMDEKTPMKAGVDNASVHCDEPGCGWSEEVKFSDFKNWHHQPCPKCGRGEIINNLDMVIVRRCEMAIQISNDLHPAGSTDLVDVQIDTAPLRKIVDNPPAR